LLTLMLNIMLRSILITRKRMSLLNLIAFEIHREIGGWP
jgi:hypothetical protein